MEKFILRSSAKREGGDDLEGPVAKRPKDGDSPPVASSKGDDDENKKIRWLNSLSKTEASALHAAMASCKSFERKSTLTPAVDVQLRALHSLAGAATPRDGRWYASTFASHSGD